MSSIPIPSFTTAVSGSIFPDAAHDGKKASANRQQIKSKAKTRIAAADTINSRDNIIPARWNTRALMQLEVALQHWFRRQKATSINVEEFFALVLKLDWTKAKGVGAFEDSQLENLAVNAEKTTDKDVETNAVASHEKQCQGLQWEERLWHDFTCATTESFGDDTILYHFDKEQQMLELIPHSSDQMRLRLASKQRQCICLQQSAEILRMLKDYHKKQQQMKLTKQQKAAQLMAKNEVLVPKAAVITTGMTIDERVEARAKAKQDHELLLSEQKRKDPTRATDIDRTWMIQLADALWNHARTRLQRQNMRLPGKLASNCLLKPRGEENKEKEQLSSHNKRCVMTFSDVIQAISKSRLGEASSIQIAKALTELESYKDPSWIVVMRDYSGNPSHNQNRNKNSYQWSKTATTIFITPDHYPAVRSQLTGTSMSSLKAHHKLNLTQQRTIVTTATKTNRTHNGKAVVTQETKGTEKRPGSHKKRMPPLDLSKNLLSEFDTPRAAAAGGRKTKRRKTTNS